jgi:hypothetical protein
MDEKLLRIATVLTVLPEEARLELARQLLTSNYAVVPRRCLAPIEDAFKATASRFHTGLKVELKFNPLAIGACWQAMVAEATTRRVTTLAESAAGPEEASLR